MPESKAQRSVCHATLTFSSVPVPKSLGLDALIHEKSLLLFSKAKGNSDQGCKMVAKEMCDLGVPRVPFGNFYSTNVFYTKKNKKLCPLLQAFIFISRAGKEGLYVCVHAWVCVCAHMYVRVG